MILFHCRYCKAEKYESVIDLGLQPLANAFSDSISNARQLPRYPLELLRCKACNLGQLSTTVDWREIYTDYYYLSSATKPLVAHYRQLAGALHQEYYTAGRHILDIGCNDGILLDCFEEVDSAHKVGVDPSSAAVEAIKKGYTVYNEPVSANIARKLVCVDNRRFSIITATNVFAHIDNVDDIMSALDILMDRDTVFCIEAPYLYDLIKGRYFDTIYHEHYSYLSLTPLNNLMKSRGFSVFSIEKSSVGASGPSMLYLICRDGARTVSSSVLRQLDEESESANSGFFEGYQVDIREWKVRLLETCRGLADLGEKIGCISAPAKGNTLLNYVFVDEPSLITCISEVNEKKIGTFSPGLGIPIVSEGDYLKSGITVSLLLSWNYADYFLANMQFSGCGHKLIVPLPEIKIYFE